MEIPQAAATSTGEPLRLCYPTREGLSDRFLEFGNTRLSLIPIDYAFDTRRSSQKPPGRV